MTKILIIEDEAILRNEVVEWLRLEDYEAFGAADGLKGLELALLHEPDLIVCDIMMPHLDGHGVLLELRSNPTTATIPLIFVTARASHEDIRSGMELGADDYVTKPFTRLELLKAIQSRLEKKVASEHKYQGELTRLEQSLAQEHERRMLKARLVAMFSHDFRNPLTSVLSSASLLRDYGHRMDVERQQTHFNRIEGSVRQLLQMLDDMLIVTQMEVDGLKFEPQSLNLAQFFQNIVDEFRLIYGETHSIAYENSVSGEVNADPRLLRQIASNLITNAIKYSPQGKEICVSLSLVDNALVLSVADHGIGIPEADQQRIFESFQRASNVGRIKGTGLGLAIVQQAANVHRGVVHLKSEVGEGTTVTVKVPVK